jgi:hypothetical protein
MYKGTKYTLQVRKHCHNALMHGHGFFPGPATPNLYLSHKLFAYFLYHIRVILVCLIFFCSWKMPNMSASAVGGQPGT